MTSFTDRVLDRPGDPPRYWLETDRRIAVENYHDQRAARDMNADRLLEIEAERTHV